MDKNLETERFRQVLIESLDEAENKVPALSELEPLDPEFEARLLHISLGAPRSRTLRARIGEWFEEKFVRRFLIPATLVPAVALLALLLSNVFSRAPVERLALVARVESPRKVLGGPAETVSSQTELHIKRGQYLSLSLTPKQKQADVAVRSFIKHGETLTPWVPFDSTEDGSFVLYAPIDNLPNLEKSQEILLVVGRPQSLPDAAVLRAEAKTEAKTEHRDWYKETLRLYVDD